MQYWKVKDMYDGHAVWNGRVPYYLIGKELYTDKEREKIYIPDRMLERVDISKRNVFWLFGARFDGSRA